MKKTAIVLALLCFAACAAPASNTGNKEGQEALQPAAQIVVDGRTCIEGLNIIEILKISPTDGNETPEIARINDAIDEKVTAAWTEFREIYNSWEGDGTRPWMEIRSYPFADERYLQIVTSISRFSTEGEERQVYSFNYDMQEGKYIDLESVLEAIDYHFDEMTKTAIEESIGGEGVEVSEAVPKGFLYITRDGKEMVSLYLDCKLGDSEYIDMEYTPANGQAKNLNNQHMYSAEDGVTTTDPPVRAITDEVPIASPGTDK